ncbi:hypothetical protein LLS1_21750 [Leifsonia sp. LS1]|uniref:hypothetical protein n=1 Tax=Leifsonia sp. LS1 TaxID=2828483 RepID=UPI001CFEC603|nr:hypothetical protein [Leifsonia sp. LS1]GIT80506.1 hypothetical protein LLS1_21750 [Leifsonia sp. LS1]
MSWRDFDLAPKVVSGAPEYGWRTANPVDAAPVQLGDDVVGYIATSVDATENVLKMFTSAANPDYFNNGSRFWRDRIAAAGAQQVPAHDTFRALLGTDGPEGSGRVSAQPERFENTDAIVERLDPGRVRPSSARSRERGSAPTRDEIDAVLRGRGRPTAEIQARIAALDEATHRRPAPDDVVVALPYDTSTIPGDAAVGTIVHEPTYLTSTFLTGETRIDAPTRLVLRVTKGTPALYTPPAPGERGAGVLLLGRGIDWQITSIAPGEIQGTVLRAEPRS